MNPANQESGFGPLSWLGCGQKVGSAAARASALPAFIEHYNWERPHSACGGLPPMSRIVGVNNLSAHNN